MNAIVFRSSVHINFHKNETDSAVNANKKRRETETMEAGKEATTGCLETPKKKDVKNAIGSAVNGTGNWELAGGAPP